MLRNHILKQVESAVWNDDYAYRQASATIVVVGGGPTGIETAGALLELSEQIVSELPRRDERIKLNVILVQAGDHLLAPYPPKLQASARDQLASLGVEIIFNDPLVETGFDQVRLKSGRVIQTKTLVWAAGVKASPLGQLLDVQLAHADRVPIEATTEAAGLENIYVVGDMAYLEDEGGVPYPMLIPVAEQQGILAAENILHKLNNEAQAKFEYNDRGMMATIGRNRAVAWMYNRLPLTGFLAWFAWLSMHLLWLFGLRNRLNVLINWIWYYFAQERSVRMIFEPAELAKLEEAHNKQRNN